MKNLRFLGIQTLVAIALMVPVPAVAQNWEPVAQLENGDRYSLWSDVTVRNEFLIGFLVRFEPGVAIGEEAYTIIRFTGECGARPYSNQAILDFSVYNSQNQEIRSGRNYPASWEQPQSRTIGGTILARACRKVGRQAMLRPSR